MATAAGKRASEARKEERRLEGAATRARREADRARTAAESG